MVERCGYWWSEECRTEEGRYRERMDIMKQRPGGLGKGRSHTVVDNTLIMTSPVKSSSTPVPDALG